MIRRRVPCAAVTRAARFMSSSSDEVFQFQKSPIPSHSRVVVTGVGFVTPCGIGQESLWDKVLQGVSATRSLTRMDLPPEHEGAFDSLPSRVVGKVDMDEVVREIQARTLRGVDAKSPPFVQYASIAADEALRDAGWFPSSAAACDMTGVAIGAGMSSTYELGQAGRLIEHGKIRRLSPYFVPRILVNAAAGAVSMSYDLHGPNHAASTACATGAHAIGDAFRMIQRGDARVMIAGGTESCVDAISLSGFARIKALSTAFHDSPETASRPFDKDRDGFVLSEGASMLVLEDADHALARGARIYCEIIGYGMSSDAYHVTKPREDGYGARLAMQRALSVAGCDPEDVSYINAHATSTPIGDLAELHAIQSVFFDSALQRGPRRHPLYVSSSKGTLGHLLGAAGAVEAAISCLACYHRQCPPTANLNKTDITTVSGCELVSKDPVNLQDETPRVAVMSNSFGFGGTNTSLLFTSTNT
ncbi:3-oxoacyl-[acyl-carrier-protein] synthase [Picochlorum sp. SENEW3]|nr:3-oxoacyl-[acyl-carrier-protein] synthase [Picochlorum sp. SENEW3]